jgi:tripartite-type tricarboxylate transporter receptor subunit TctC
MASPIVARLQTETVRILNAAEVKERLTGLGADAVTNTPDEFAAHIKSEIAKWSKSIKETGVKVDWS